MSLDIPFHRTALPAINPSECYATTNFLEPDFATGIGPVTTNELAATAREDWRATDQARQILLVVAGRGTSAPAAVWPDAAADLGAAGAERVAHRLRLQNLGPREDGRSGV
jgi:hypothetical protein